jgi:5-methylcytosine-specific restriction endonuclease McrA
LRAGPLDNHCNRCGITDWRGKAVSLELHHVSGFGGDSRLANLEILCPNCHSQTDSWGGRNSRRRARANAAKRGIQVESSRAELAC